MRIFIARSRFTLIEMMMVLVIVMALSAFGVGVYNYTRNVMAETRTKALIVRLDTVFRELYEKYGVYPKSIQDGALLFPDISDDLDNESSMLNKLRTESYSCLNGFSDAYIRDFVNKIDLPNLIRENGWEITSGTYSDYYCLLDGWSRPLYYSRPGKWNSQSFDLCSSGADGFAFKIDLSSEPGSGTEWDWEQKWASSVLKGANDKSIWKLDEGEYILINDASNENDATGDLRFSPVYGDDITNF